MKQRGSLGLWYNSLEHVAACKWISTWKLNKLSGLFLKQKCCLIKHVQVLFFLYDILVQYHTWYEYGTSSWEYCAMHDNVVRIKLCYYENYTPSLY